MKGIPDAVNHALHFFISICFILIIDGYFVAESLLYRRIYQLGGDVIVVQYIFFVLVLLFHLLSLTLFAVLYSGNKITLVLTILDAHQHL